jgi:hypothetical protein
MIRSWVPADYLGHKNLKSALDSIKRGLENVALTPANLCCTFNSSTLNHGMGTVLRVQQTFIYRIEDTTYVKGMGITSNVNTGDATPYLLPRTATDQTAASTNNITSGYYRAGVLLIDASGNFSTKVCSTQASNLNGLYLGGRAQALAYLVSELSTTDLSTKAIVAFYSIGSGAAAYLATTSLVIATDIDLYQVGGMVLSSGNSTDGGQMLGLI